MMIKGFISIMALLLFFKPCYGVEYQLEAISGHASGVMEWGDPSSWVDGKVPCITEAADDILLYPVNYQNVSLNDADVVVEWSASQNSCWLTNVSWPLVSSQDRLNTLLRLSPSSSSPANSPIQLSGNHMELAGSVGLDIGAEGTSAASYSVSFKSITWNGNPVNEYWIGFQFSNSYTVKPSSSLSVGEMSLSVGMRGRINFESVKIDNLQMSAYAVLDIAHQNALWQGNITGTSVSKSARGRGVGFAGTTLKFQDSTLTNLTLYLTGLGPVLEPLGVLKLRNVNITGEESSGVALISLEGGSVDCQEGSVYLSKMEINSPSSSQRFQVSSGEVYFNAVRLTSPHSIGIHLLTDSRAIISNLEIVNGILAVAGGRISLSRYGNLLIQDYGIIDDTESRGIDGDIQASITSSGMIAIRSSEKQWTCKPELILQRGSFSFQSSVTEHLEFAGGLILQGSPGPSLHIVAAPNSTAYTSSLSVIGSQIRYQGRLIVLNLVVWGKMNYFTVSELLITDLIQLNPSSNLVFGIYLKGNLTLEDNMSISWNEHIASNSVAIITSGKLAIGKNITITCAHPPDMPAGSEILLMQWGDVEGSFSNIRAPAGWKAVQYSNRIVLIGDGSNTTSSNPVTTGVSSKSHDPTTAPKEDEEPVGLIVGLTIGGIVFFLGVIVLIAIAVKVKKRREQGRFLATHYDYTSGQDEREVEHLLPSSKWSTTSDTE